MDAKIEFLEQLVDALDAAEFGTLRFVMGERIAREEKALKEKIDGLKSRFAWTPAEIRLLSQNANIEVIKSIRRRLGLGLREAKMLFDEMKAVSK